MLHILTILVFVGAMIPLILYLLICAAPVVVDKNALRNLEMILVMNLLMMMK